MRLRIEITTTARSLPWPKVLAPGRGVVYAMLGKAAPALASKLHGDGWGPHRMVPFGFGPPVFPEAVRTPGTYAAGGCGYVEFGSPVVDIAHAMATEVLQQSTISWGGIPLQVTRVIAVEAPPFTDGIATMRTTTPVVLKGAPSSDDMGESARTSWLLPDEPDFARFFERNLTRKAETLDLPAQVRVVSVKKAGPQRSFSVGNGSKPGANVRTDLYADPELLKALWSWGLGQANASGFGWIADD